MADTGVNGSTILLKIGSKLLAGQLSASLDETIDLIQTTHKLTSSSAKTYIAGEYGATMSVECSVDPSDSTNTDYWEVRSTMISREPVQFTLGGIEAGDKYMSGNCVISGLSKANPQSDKVTFTLNATVTGLPTVGTVTT